MDGVCHSLDRIVRLFFVRNAICMSTRKSVPFKWKHIGALGMFMVPMLPSIAPISLTFSLVFSFAFRSLLHVVFLSFLGIIFGLLTKFSFGRKLLLNYPKVFSLGFVSHEGPTEEKMKKTKFSITFYGDGWPKEEALSEPTDSHTTPPSKKLVTRVSASNPGMLTAAHELKLPIIDDEMFSAFA